MHDCKYKFSGSRYSLRRHKKNLSIFVIASNPLVRWYLTNTLPKFRLNPINPHTQLIHLRPQSNFRRDQEINRQILHLINWIDYQLRTPRLTSLATKKVINYTGRLPRKCNAIQWHCFFTSYLQGYREKRSLSQNFSGL